MDQILAKLLEHGLPGIVIAILLYKNWDMTKRMREIEDARNKETKEYLTAYSGMSNVLQMFQAELRGKLESVKDAITNLRKD